MKIAVLDMASKEGGALTILKSIYNYVANGNAANHEWYFFIVNQDIQDTEYVKIVRFPQASKGRVHRFITKFIDVNRKLKELGIDCVVCLNNTCLSGCSIPQFVYLHQAIPFQTVKNFSFLKKRERRHAIAQYILGHIIKKSVRKAETVFVQTDWMKTAVSNSVGRSNVVNIGYPKELELISKLRTDKTASKEFFYPCTPYIHKNIETIVNAVSLLRKKGHIFRFYITLTEEKLLSLAGCESFDREIFACLGKITQQEVLELYTKTTLVFPSYIESLGLPLVEAKNANIWIIASDCPFSHEILDNYGNRDFFATFNASELANRMERILRDNVKLSPAVNEQSKNKYECWFSLVRSIEERMNHFLK